MITEKYNGFLLIRLPAGMTRPTHR